MTEIHPSAPATPSTPLQRDVFTSLKYSRLFRQFGLEVTHVGKEVFGNVLRFANPSIMIFHELVGETSRQADVVGMVKVFQIDSKRTDGEE